METIDFLIDLLEINAYYAIDVSLFPGNPTHRALLYTGQGGGALATIFSGSYDKPIKSFKKAKAKVVQRLDILEQLSGPAPTLITYDCTL